MSNLDQAAVLASAFAVLVCCVGVLSVLVLLG